MRGWRGWALGLVVLVAVAGGGAYLLLSERASDRRVDAALAALELADAEAELAGGLRDAAQRSPTAPARERLGELTRRAEKLADRAGDLPEELDDEAAARLDRAARGQLEGARAIARAVAPAGGAVRTVERAGREAKARRPLRGAQRTLAQVKADIAPAGRRLGAALSTLRGALDAIQAQLAEEDGFDGATEQRLTEATDVVRELGAGGRSELTGTTRRFARLERRADAAIVTINRKLAARRRATRRRARRQAQAAEEARAAEEAQAESPPLVMLPNGQPGNALPPQDRTLGCVGTDATTGECVGD